MSPIAAAAAADITAAKTGVGMFVVVTPEEQERRRHQQQQQQQQQQQCRRVAREGEGGEEGEEDDTLPLPSHRRRRRRTASAEARSRLRGRRQRKCELCPSHISGNNMARHMKSHIFCPTCRRIVTKRTHSCAHPGWEWQEIQVGTPQRTGYIPVFFLPDGQIPSTTRMPSEQIHGLPTKDTLISAANITAADATYPVNMAAVALNHGGDSGGGPARGRIIASQPPPSPAAVANAVHRLAKHACCGCRMGKPRSSSMHVAPLGCRSSPELKLAKNMHLLWPLTAESSWLRRQQLNQPLVREVIELLSNRPPTPPPPRRETMEEMSMPIL